MLYIKIETNIACLIIVKCKKGIILTLGGIFMRIKKQLTILLVIFLLVFNTFAVQAHGSKKDDDKSTNQFKDVKEDHWAYKYIMLMSQLGIINGYSDGNYKPGDAVSRAEFAKMMVLTLQLNLINPNSGTFLDVNKGDWDYQFVETAKNYLTGYKNSQGIYFKPTQDAQREDMAVAIIKALNKSPSTDLSILGGLADQGSISPNLKGYVAAAMKEGIMVGDSSAKFNPQGTLTRAEAATLLGRLIMDEKIVFDDSKIVIGDTTTTTTTTVRTPVLITPSYSENKVTIKWNKVDASNFSYYAVVLSKNDLTPAYPDNGYITIIASPTTTSCEVKVGDLYNNGDVGNIQAGVTYNVAVTAVYGNDKYTSANTQVLIPNSKTPKLTTSAIADGVRLTWTKTASDNFSYYVVVLSKNDTTPTYPDNGYLVFIPDRNAVSYDVKTNALYIDGDVGTIQPGATYNVTITAVYGNNKYTSSTAQLTIPDTRTPKLTTAAITDGVKLTWTKTASDNFSYYAVVLSKSDTTPKYPENGYLALVTDRGTTSYELKLNAPYTNGDGGTIQPGETYNVTITAVYGDNKYTSTTTQVTVPGTRTPSLTSSLFEGGVKLTWTKTASDKFSYYAINLSTNNPTLSYPGDGYVALVPENGTTNFVLKAGQVYQINGVSTVLEAGKTYFVTITAVYSDGLKYYTVKPSITITLP